MQKIILFAASALVILSCGDPQKESGKSSSDTYGEELKKVDSLNKIESFGISHKYNAITDDDTSIVFTYQLQDAVKTNGRVLSVDGYINDIVKKDSSYFLIIDGYFLERRLILQISISNNQFKELTNNRNLNDLLKHEGCFVFKPTSIKANPLMTADSDIETDDNAETVEEANANASSTLTYDVSDVMLLMKGQLIDFYLYREPHKRGG